MPKTLQYILSVYRASLWLYPADLRQTYGTDMAAIFEQTLHAEATRHGVRGAVRIGFRAAGELLTVAVPRHLTSDGMMTTVLTLLINSGILAMLVWFMMYTPPFRALHH